MLYVPPWGNTLFIKLFIKYIMNAYQALFLVLGTHLNKNKYFCLCKAYILSEKQVINMHFTCILIGFNMMFSILFSPMYFPISIEISSFQGPGILFTECSFNNPYSLIFDENMGSLKNVLCQLEKNVCSLFCCYLLMWPLVKNY